MGKSAKPEIILASTSPRRIELLKNIGIDFEIIDPCVSEEGVESDPTKYAIENALAKASAVTSKLKRGIVIGADTIVVIEDRILGKPRNQVEAKRMLELISGRTHEVITGIAVIDVSKNMIKTASEHTEVKIRKLTISEIDAYVASGEPMDKAGAYAAQGKGALLIERINGCFYNVVGLPLFRLSMILEQMDYNIIKKL